MHRVVIAVMFLYVVIQIIYIVRLYTTYLLFITLRYRFVSFYFAAALRMAITYAFVLFLIPKMKKPTNYIVFSIIVAVVLKVEIICFRYCFDWYFKSRTVD